MPLGNRLGTKLVILSGIGLALLGLIVILLSGTVLTLSVAFALAGAGMSAMLVGFNGYVLELGTPVIRPLLFALEGTLVMPLYFMPLLGGWGADLIGYRPLVVAGSMLLLAALAVAGTLCEPRRGDTRCGPCGERAKPGNGGQVS
jgi:MFS family permease